MVTRLDDSADMIFRLPLLHPPLLFSTHVCDIRPLFLRQPSPSITLLNPATHPTLHFFYKQNGPCNGECTTAHQSAMLSSSITLPLPPCGATPCVPCVPHPCPRPTFGHLSFCTLFHLSCSNERPRNFFQETSLHSLPSSNHQNAPAEPILPISPLGEYTLVWGTLLI